LVEGEGEGKEEREGKEDSEGEKGEKGEKETTLEPYPSHASDRRRLRSASVERVGRRRRTRREGGGRV
jgi:hypothetical protein